MLKEDRRTKYTKKVLKESLLAIMKEKPISKITIKEICEAADINRTTFYVHYSDQYDLLHHIEDEIMSEINKALTHYDFVNDDDQTLQMLERILEFITQNRSSCEVLLLEQGELLKRIMEVAQIKSELAILSNNTIDTETAEYLNLFVINGCLGIVQHWIKTGMKKTYKEIAAIISSVICQREGLS